jgi:hypothetical protein
MPRRDDEPSGRFVIRLSSGLHAGLRARAREQGLSLNEYCVRRLSTPASELDAPATAVVERALSLFGTELVAVAVFGSWARGEATEASDVDLLIVVERGVRLTRSLYRRWDETPLEWRGRRAEPQFVHLPEPGSVPSGLWAEVALDGVVVHERGLRLSRWLVEVRRAIAAGQIVRRFAHGQPYWRRSDVA